MFVGEKEFWTKKGQQGDDWFFDQIEITSGGPGFKVIFEGTVGSGDLGDIALDDLSMLSTKCPPPPTQPPLCYTCQTTGKCIDMSMVRFNGCRIVLK